MTCDIWVKTVQFFVKSRATWDSFLQVKKRSTVIPFFLFVHNMYFGSTNMVFFCFTSNCEVKHQKEKKTAKKTSGSKNNFTETKKNLKKTGKGEMFSPERQTSLISKQLRRITVKKREEPSGSSFCQIMSNWFCFEIRTSTYILHEYSK